MITNKDSKGRFTRREGYPSKRVNPSRGSKIARVYKKNFTGRVTPRGVLTEYLGGDVRRASGNPYLISDQNM